MENKKYAAQEKYDATHAKRYGLKLNIKTDADIIKKLDEVKNTIGIQAYIKNAIRKDLSEN